MTCCLLYYYRRRHDWIIYDEIYFLCVLETAMPRLIFLASSQTKCSVICDGRWKIKRMKKTQSLTINLYHVHGLMTLKSISHQYCYNHNYISKIFWRRQTFNWQIFFLNCLWNERSSITFLFTHTLISVSQLVISVYPPYLLSEYIL